MAAVWCGIAMCAVRVLRAPPNRPRETYAGPTKRSIVTLNQLRALIADDDHAGRFLTREAYRMSLLVASVDDTVHSDATTAARERKQQELIAAELKRARV